MSAMKSLTKFSALFWIIVLISVGCSPQHEGFQAPSAFNYTYQNPESDKPAELRPSHYQNPHVKISNTSAAANPQIGQSEPVIYFNPNPTIQVDRATSIISFEIIQTTNSISETIILQGELKDTGFAHLEDMDSKVLGHSRLKAVANCIFITSCAELSVDVYYLVNNEVKSIQFITKMPEDPSNIELKITNPQQTNNVMRDKKESPLTIKKDMTTTKNKSTSNSGFSIEVDIDHGEDLVSDEGTYISKPLSDEHLKNLRNNNIENNNVKNETRINAGKEESKYKTELIHLNLNQGGIARGRPNNGLILNPVSKLSENRRTGLFRHAKEDESHGTGLLIDFIKEISEVFYNNEKCGTVVTNHLSLYGGGVFPFRNSPGAHQSHQNGLDADIFYINGNLKRVVQNQSIVSNFDYNCNWKFFEYLLKPNLPNGQKVVSRILVNSSVKIGFCKWAKENNKLESGKEILRHLYPISGHTSHFHLRLRCSPSHTGCWQEAELPNITGC